MKFKILNYYTGENQFIAEIDCDDNAPQGMKIGLAAKWGYKNSADLSRAYLSDADLFGAS